MKTSWFIRRVWFQTATDLVMSSWRWESLAHSCRTKHLSNILSEAETWHGERSGDAGGETHGQVVSVFCFHYSSFTGSTEGEVEPPHLFLDCILVLDHFLFVFVHHYHLADVILCHVGRASLGGWSPSCSLSLNGSEAGICSQFGRILITWTKRSAENQGIKTGS